MATMTQVTDTLQKDHRQILRLFDQFGRARKPRQKTEITARIVEDLSLHTAIEEEIFYPMLRLVLGEERLADYATDQHYTAGRLMKRLSRMNAADSGFTDTVQELEGLIRRHISEEEIIVHSIVENSSEVDLTALNAQWERRKNELLAEKRAA